MAYLESSVVVYIRALYYPDGFAFPLKLMSQGIMITELFRELATMVMLIGAAYIAAKKPVERFAYFIYSFAVWDIFYYVFLKVLIDWPQSMFTWDILFLIPTTWVGPVIAPVINSVTMIILALIILYLSNVLNTVKIKFVFWCMLIVGSLLTIWVYVKDYIFFMLQKFTIAEIFDMSNTKATMEYALVYVPQRFDWILFGIAELVFFTTIIWLYRSNFSLKENMNK